jgi:hypothetical protein
MWWMPNPATAFDTGLKREYDDGLAIQATPDGIMDGRFICLPVGTATAGSGQRAPFLGRRSLRPACDHTHVSVPRYGFDQPLAALRVGVAGATDGTGFTVGVPHCLLILRRPEYRDERLEH